MVDLKSEYINYSDEGKKCMKSPDEIEEDQELAKEIDKLHEDYYIFGMEFSNYSSCGPIFFKECPLTSYSIDGIALIPRTNNEYIQNEEEAREVFTWELTLWQQYNEWDIFQVEIQELQIWRNEERKEERQEWETIDSCGGFYGSQDKEYREAINLIHEGFLTISTTSIN